MNNNRLSVVMRLKKYFSILGADRRKLNKKYDIDAFFQRMLNYSELCFASEEQVAKHTGYADDPYDIDREVSLDSSGCSNLFSKHLIHLIDSKGLKDSKVYRRAMVNRSAFGKLKNGDVINPKRSTVLALCFGMQLDMIETIGLMRSAGYVFPYKADGRDAYLSYCIKNKLYDVNRININLDKKNYGLLGLTVRGAC